MKIELIDTDKIIPYLSNSKIHTEEQIKMIATSIDKFKFDQPIVIDENNVIIKGHGRLLAAQYLKLKKCPCIIRADMSEAEKKASRIVDNRSNESEWDWAALDVELAELKDMDVDLSWLEFDENDFPTYINEGLTEEDAISEEVEPICKEGDLWKLGGHRLLCGDATKKEDVERLMDGDKANLFFTDPPYSVNYTQKAKEVLKSKNYVEIINDDLTTEETAKKIWSPAFKNAYDYCFDDASFYITMPQGGDQMMMMMMNQNWRVRHELIWVKEAPVFSMGRLDYDYMHEPIAYGWKKKHKFFGKGEHVKSVWVIKRTENKLHPTMKPVNLVVNAINNSTLDACIVLDLFLGSGSTLVACEKTNRKCFGMEIDEHYCDVIIKRWEDFTGKTAVKINET